MAVAHAASPSLSKRSLNESQQSAVGITYADDVRTFDADVIRTYSDSSGSLSYDSGRSAHSFSLDAAKIDGRYVKSNSDEQLTKAPNENIIDESKPTIRIIDAAELKRRAPISELPVDSKTTLVAFGQRETELTKDLIYETIDQYFESPRDDIDLMLRISRNDMLPRLHIDLQPSNEVIAKENQRAETSLTSDYRLSSNHRSCTNVNSSIDSDTSTAHPIGKNYIDNVFSYLRTVVKTIIPRREYGRIEVKRTVK